MEAADGQSNNARVIVQFTDPNNLFDSVAPLLQNRLPLGNLHWKSPTRPLRSIEELDVSLDREVKQSIDGANAARRHQIPGLRQTPFVKVLLLRCDDKERYKESVRKEVKDWVKSLGFSTSGKGTTNKQERHDAYEYLIVHVVVPGTPAAAQPKSSKHISVEATESTDSVNSKSKWTGKSTSTIFDKLRADFSSSSKTPFERVAQVRLLDSGKPSTALSPLELEQQWQDLVEKLKTAILHSFDVRVAQYEDDIRERESQRNLPGWNFCTFFILKEGLGRGFENVGLLEDALQIYEELDLGLDGVIQDQSKPDADTTNVLLPFATDLKDTIRKVLDKQSIERQSTVALSLQAWATAESNRFPWRLERRNYQNMILTNQVSVLDFRIYIFIREMQILLRQASMPLPSARPKSAERQSGSRWDADLLSEICGRSVRFMNLAARNLRQDLLTAWGGQEGLGDEEATTQKVAIDNIVASWKWASLLQTLTECQIIGSLSVLSARLHGDHQDGQLFSPKDIANSRVRTDSVSTTTSEKSVNGAMPDIFAMLRVVKGSKTDLVFQAAELFTMLRTIFLQLCRQAGLLRDLQKAVDPGVVQKDVAGTGVLAPSLRAMLQSEDTAKGAYKLLTICACQCYTSAGKSRASRQMLFDLAKFEIHNGNHEAAVSWLDTIPGFLETPPATWMDESMMKIYVGCLREAGRNADLVKSLFLYLQSDRKGRVEDMQPMWEEMNRVASQTEATDLDFKAIFDVPNIDNFITHGDDDHHSVIGMSLGVKIPIEELGRARVLIDCQSRGQHSPTNLTFKHEGFLSLTDGRVHIRLLCPTNTEGWYNLTSVRIIFGNITFKHDLRHIPVVDEEESTFNRRPPAPSVYMYSCDDSPTFEVSHAALVDLSVKRRIWIRITWGSKDVTSAQLRLKPATAGLRLDLQSTLSSEVEQPFSIVRQDDTHLLDFDKKVFGNGNSFEIPYSLDEPSTMSVSLRAELNYDTKTGSFQLFEVLSLMVLLPISVSVQDVFQRDAVFSRFTFTPSRPVPISITHCGIESNGGLDILDGDSWTGEAVNAFPKQPINWVVQMKRKNKQYVGELERQKLALNVTYICFDEIILGTVLQSFNTQVNSSSYRYALRPLQAHLRNKLQTLWTEAEIEVCALTGEVDMWGFDSLDWSSVLHAFDRRDRLGMESWLKSWHDQLNESPLDLQSIGVSNRVLRLSVDPPETQIIIRTQLITLTHACVVGQPCMAKVQVSATAFLPDYDLAQIEISLEIPSQSQSTSENWLIGGQRKVSFQASQPEFESTIILVAQRTGQLILPGIEVRCRHLGEKGGKQVNFEVEHLSVATSIQVRNAVETTTVAIAEGDGAEKHWLMSATKPQ